MINFLHAIKNADQSNHGREIGSSGTASNRVALQFRYCDMMLGVICCLALTIPGSFCLTLFSSHDEKTQLKNFSNIPIKKNSNIGANTLRISLSLVSWSCSC